MTVRATVSRPHRRPRAAGPPTAGPRSSTDRRRRSPARTRSGSRSGTGEARARSRGNGRTARPQPPLRLPGARGHTVRLGRRPLPARVGEGEGTTCPAAHHFPGRDPDQPFLQQPVQRPVRAPVRGTTRPPVMALTSWATAQPCRGAFAGAVNSSKVGSCIPRSLMPTEHSVRRSLMPTEHSVRRTIRLIHMPSPACWLSVGIWASGVAPHDRVRRGAGCGRSAG